MEKFDFSRDFENETAGQSATVKARRETRSSKVIAAHEAGYAEGRDDAVAEAERRAADAVERLAAIATDLFNTVNLELEQARDEANQLGSFIARRYVGNLLRELPENFVTEAIDTCLEVARREARLTIELSEELNEKIRPMIEDRINQQGLTENVNIGTAPSLKGVTCRLDWLRGGADVSLEETLAQVEATVEDQIRATQAARAQERDSTERQSA